MHRFLILGLAIRLRNFYRSVKRVIFDLRTSLIEYSLYCFYVNSEFQFEFNFFLDRFAEAGDDDEDSEGDETIERVIERLRDVNHSYLEKSKQVRCL
jgi:hypothetical protein